MADRDFTSGSVRERTDRETESLTKFAEAAIRTTETGAVLAREMQTPGCPWRLAQKEPEAEAG